MNQIDIDLLDFDSYKRVKTPETLPELSSEANDCYPSIINLEDSVANKALEWLKSKGIKLGNPQDIPNQFNERQKKQIYSFKKEQEEPLSALQKRRKILRSLTLQM